MSYDPDDAARDEFYESISKELYPDHKTQAISEFTTERLRFFYVAHPNVMIPAVEVINQGKRLNESGFSSAALIFFVTVIELLLKATVLKPVVYGLVHSAPLAEAVVEQALSQSGFDRYTKLLSRLYSEFSGLDINAIKRNNGKQNLIAECTALQALRNKIIHQGAICTITEAANGLDVVTAVYENIVFPVLAALKLTIDPKGTIEAIKL